MDNKTTAIDVMFGGTPAMAIEIALRRWPAVVLANPQITPQQRRNEHGIVCWKGQQSGWQECHP